MAKEDLEKKVPEGEQKTEELGNDKEEIAVIERKLGIMGKIGIGLKIVGIVTLAGVSFVAGMAAKAFLSNVHDEDELDDGDDTVKLDDSESSVE